MSFSTTKLVDLNIYYYLLTQVLYSEDQDQVSFDEEVEGEELARVALTSPKIKVTDNRAFRAENGNWIYFINTYTPVIKKNGFVIDSAEYTINYPEGLVLFNRAYSRTLDAADIISADYRYMTVGVLDGYPYDLISKPDTQQDRLPVVAVEYMDGSDTPFEIGRAKGLQIRSFSVHVVGSSDSEREDITGVIRDALRISIPVVDYRTGMPLKYDGTKNSNYTIALYDDSRIEFDQVRDRVLRVANPNPAQRFWSVVTFLTRSLV